MTTTKHIHKLKRLKFKSGNIIFFCALPDCSHKTNIALALGKRSICWRCGEPFIMNEYSLRLAKPHCDNCHKPKNQTEIILNSAALGGKTDTLIDSVDSLADRLSQTIKQAEQIAEEDEI